jgi:hypothetical protein
MLRGVHPDFCKTPVLPDLLAGFGISFGPPAVATGGMPLRFGIAKAASQDAEHDAEIKRYRTEMIA